MELKAPLNLFYITERGSEKCFGMGGGIQKKYTSE